MGIYRQIMGPLPRLNKLETISTSEERHVPHKQDASPIADDILELKNTLFSTSESTQKRA